MATKRHTSAQIIQKLRAIEVHISKGMTTRPGCRWPVQPIGKDELLSTMSLGVRFAIGEHREGIFQ